MSLGIGRPQSRCFPHLADNVFPSFSSPLSSPISPAFLGWSLHLPLTSLHGTDKFFSLSAHFTGQVCRFALPSSSRLGLEACIPRTLQHSCATTLDARCWARGMYWYTWTPLGLAVTFFRCFLSAAKVSCVVVPRLDHGSTDLAAVFRCLDRGILSRSVKRRDAPISRPVRFERKMP